MNARYAVWTSVILGEAVRAILRNKVRSTLTVIGIMIGIAAVVWVVAIGQAGSERAEAQLQNLGDNLVWIEAGSRNVNGMRTGTHGTNTLTMEDDLAILSEVPLIKMVSPQADGNIQVIFGNRNWNTHYRGVSPEFLEIKLWPVAEGAPFTDSDVERAANTCILGQTVRERIFGAANPIGQIIRVGPLLFQVVGVLAKKGQSATGQDQDDTVLMPYTTAQKKIRGKGYAWLDDIMCAAVSRAAVEEAIHQVTALLRQRHQIRPEGDDDFNIRRPDELLKAQVEAQNTLALLLISIASVSLVVGGIGIMNVMLASVAQRTREIGLRLAVGATESAVQMQFLGEAVMLSLFGGILGVCVSLAGSFVIGRMLEWPMVISPQAIGLALAFSIGVGIFFGYYPARKASKMDPIAALRHE